MKKTFALIAFLSFLSANTTGAQSTDRFIRIVGNAKKEYKASSATVSLSVSEVQPNEYRNVRYKTEETVLQDLITALKKLGYTESDLTKDDAAMFNSYGSYQNPRTTKYKLFVKNLSQLENLDLIVEGVKFSEARYQFDAPGPEAEEAMALEAVKDAERKAKKLAADTNKKVGKILNIEDTSSGCCRTIAEGQQPKTAQNYRVNITFELLD
jgi:uncharacterized protein YggE